jgi:hypothetical protein
MAPKEAPGNGAISSPNSHLQRLQNEGQKWSVLIAFMAMKVCCSTEMERVAGSDQKKCCFLTNHQIGPANVENKTKQKFAILQILFSQLLSKICHSCFI